MNPIITTVTLNAAIDKTYYVPALAKGKVTRVAEVVATAGGKGINVARVLKQLGHADVKATGFAGGYNGQYIRDRVKAAGIREEFVETSGESRICLNVIDRVDGSSTELLEPGPEVGAERLEMFKRKLKRLSAESALVIFSGSIPSGLPVGLYADLIGISRAEGAEVFLDTSGEALIQGTKAKPSFIKPNEDEIVALLGNEGEDLYEGVLSLQAKGVANVAVTLGADGAVAAVSGQRYRITIPGITPVNTVGSGDSFVAGFAYGFVRNWPAEECLRYAAAAGSANALSPTTGDVDPGDHRRLLRQITVEPWKS